MSSTDNGERSLSLSGDSSKQSGNPSQPGRVTYVVNNRPNDLDSSLLPVGMNLFEKLVVVQCKCDGYAQPPDSPIQDEDHCRSKQPGALEMSQSSHHPQASRSPASSIPKTNRDSCGACGNGHDIRYCPYPNTLDGRTKICPICDTSDHAWFQCEYYEQDAEQQWEICWMNRSCLPTLVHNTPLQEIFASKAISVIEKTDTDAMFASQVLGGVPGPLSPGFVINLIHPGSDNSCAQLTIMGLLPWKLERQVLESSQRAFESVRDPLTNFMRMETRVKGTKSNKHDVPKARTLEFFHNEVVAQPQTNQQTFPSDHCEGCDSAVFMHDMRAGHHKSECDRPCRLCVMEDKDSNTKLKDCKEHCSIHLCPIDDGGLDHHVECLEWSTKRCGICMEPHWLQDCTKFLANICPVQSCRKRDCKSHCNACGCSMDILKLPCPQEWKNNSEMWERLVSDLFADWHAFLHGFQWIRRECPDAGIKQGMWAMLQCKTHGDVMVKADALATLRRNAWNEAVEYNRQDYDELSIKKALRVLTAPECKKCFEMMYIEGTADYDLRTSGVLTAWGKDIKRSLPTLVGGAQTRFPSRRTKYRPRREAQILDLKDN